MYKKQYMCLESFHKLTNQRFNISEGGTSVSHMDPLSRYCTRALNPVCSIKGLQIQSNASVNPRLRAPCCRDPFFLVIKSLMTGKRFFLYIYFPRLDLANGLKKKSDFLNHFNNSHCFDFIKKIPPIPSEG